MSDILVIGSGPAGCVAALHLSRLGFDVAVTSVQRRKPAVEGMSERVVEGLARAGFTAALRAVGPEVPRDARWNGERRAVNVERIVERERLDAALLDDLVAAGIRLIPAAVTETSGAPGDWTVQLSGEAGTEAHHTKFIVEARGRQAPRGGGVSVRGPMAVALAKPFAVPVRPAFTSVAAFPDGWAWFADLGDGRAVLQVVLDGGPHLRSQEGMEAAHAEATYALAEAAEWLGPEARPSGAVTAREAGGYLHDVPIGAGVARVGDACMAVDPLSGHGVFEAVGGAMALAPVVNTLLRRPEDTAVAEAFYRGRAEEAFYRHGRVGRDLYALEQRWTDRPFWQQRAVWPDLLPSHPAPGSQDISIRVVTRPVIENGFIVSRPVVVTPDVPRGLRFIAGVEAAALIGSLTSGSVPAVEDLVARYGVSADEATTALGWLAHLHARWPVQAA